MGLFLGEFPGWKQVEVGQDQSGVFPRILPILCYRSRLCSPSL